MALQEQIEASGQWLFERRSYFPLLLVPAIVIALRGHEYPGGSHALDVIWEVICLAVGLLGLTIRVMTVGFVPDGTSSRDTRCPRAPELNTTGMYSIVRHPLYLGNFFMWLAPALLTASALLVMLVALVFWVYYERVMLAEEVFLRRAFGADFEAWATATPTFLLKPRLWRKPRLKFCLRAVLRREYSGLFALVVSMVAVESAAEWFVLGTFHLDLFWRVLLVASTLAYGTLLVLKRTTRMLHAAGR